jgi:hypothetical protein
VCALDSAEIADAIILLSEMFSGMSDFKRCVTEQLGMAVVYSLCSLMGGD